jgi:hypothetical protein
LNLVVILLLLLQCCNLLFSWGGPSPLRSFPWPAKGATGSQHSSQQQAWLGSARVRCITSYHLLRRMAVQCMHHLITSHDAYRLFPFIISLFSSRMNLTQGSLISIGP